MNISNAVTSLYNWFGAIIYYCLNFGKIPFNELYSEKYKWRNVWTGYAITLTLLISGIICILVMTN